MFRSASNLVNKMLALPCLAVPRLAVTTKFARQARCEGALLGSERCDATLKRP